MNHCGVEELVPRQPHKLEIAGSSPAAATILRIIALILVGAIAVVPIGQAVLSIARHVP